MNTKLLNFLTQGFKEKRLIFMTAGAEALAGDDKVPKAPAETPEAREARAEAAAEAAAGLDVRAELEITAGNGSNITVPASMPDFKIRHEGYIYINSAAAITPQTGDIRRLENRTVPSGYTYTYTYYTDADEWIEFSPPAAWEGAAAAAPAPVADTETKKTAELEAANDRADTALAGLEIAKQQVTVETLRRKVKEELGEGDGLLKDTIAAIAFEEGFQTSIDDNFAEVKAILTAAKTLPIAEEIDAKIKEAKDKFELMTIDWYIDEYTNLGQVKPILDLFTQYTDTAQGGTYAADVITKVRENITGYLQKGDLAPEQILDIIKNDFDEKLAKAVIADIIGETPEDFDKAIRYYKLGKYKTADETHPDFTKNQTILQKFADKGNQAEIKARGITFEFFGSTNNVDHKLVTDPDWHKDKAAALEKILDLNAAVPSRLGFTPKDTILTDQANVDLINAYIAAVRGNTDYMKLLRDNYTKFLTGGTIFDLALRLQRAAEFKRFVEDKPADEGTSITDIFTPDDIVELRHQDNRSDDAMSSGVKLGIAEPTAAAAAEPAAGDAAAADAAGDAAPPATDPDAAGTAPDAAIAEAEPAQPDDYKYDINDRGLQVFTAGRAEPEIFPLDYPEEVNLSVDHGNAKDAYIEVKATIDSTEYNGFFKFKPDKSITTGSLLHEDIWEIYKIEKKDDKIIITKMLDAEKPEALSQQALRLDTEDKDHEGALKKEEPATGDAPAAPAPVAAPGGVEQLRTKNTEATENLQVALEAASSHIHELIGQLERTIVTNNAFIQGTIQTRIDDKRKLMKDTFDAVKAKLEEATKKSEAGEFLEAEAFYKQAEEIIEKVLKEELEASGEDAILSQQSKAVIVELKETVEEEKRKVEAAFDDKEEAERAFQAASASTE